MVSISKKGNQWYDMDLYNSEVIEIEMLLGQEGCPICLIGEKTLKRQWFWFFHESYGDGPCAKKYLENYGFCEKHTIQVSRLGPKWQKSVIYNFIIKNKLPQIKRLDKILKEFKLTRNPIADSWNLRNMKESIREMLPAGSCLFCDSIEQSERYYLTILLKTLNDPKMKELYTSSHGLCLKHYFIALEYIDQEYIEGLREVSEHLISKMLGIKLRFDEFFRKSDYRFAHEPKGDEETAWLSAIKLILGRLELIAAIENGDVQEMSP